jgi:hypothetical protein
LCNGDQVQKNPVPLVELMLSIWRHQCNEEMTEAPVKPTVQKKASVQVCYGYSVRMFWPDGFPSKVFSTG